MSLFPAYANLGVASPSEQSKDAEKTGKQNGFFFLNKDFLIVFSISSTEANQWLLNPSFVVPPTQEIENIESSASQLVDTASVAPETTIVDESNSNSNEVSHKKHKKEHKQHKRKKSKKEHKTKSNEPDRPKSEFTGKEDYYVDKKSDRENWSRESANKTQCPRYRIHVRRLGKLTPRQWQMLRGNFGDRKAKRYFNRKSKRTQDDQDAAKTEIAVRRDMRLTEEEFAQKTKFFNQRLGEDPSMIEVWLEYVGLQDRFYTKITKLQLTERKMDILNRALRENPGCDHLKRTYVDLIERTYPSFEVSKILSGLLEKGVCEIYPIRFRVSSSF